MSDGPGRLVHKPVPSAALPRVLPLVCVLGLILRLVAVFHLKTYNDDYSTADIGAIPYNLLQGHGYTYNGVESAYFGPGYTLLWAGLMEVFGVTGGQLVLQLLQVVALSILPIIWYGISLRIIDSKAIALVSAIALALYPELVVLSATMYSDTLVLFLWVVFLALVLRWRDSPTLASGLVLGLTTGALILTKGRMLVFVLGVVLYFLVVDRPRLRAAQLHRQLLPLAACLVLMSAWVARNAVQLHSFVVSESTFGYNLWIGHNPAANGTGKYRAGGGGLVNQGDTRPGTGFPQPRSLAVELAATNGEGPTDAVYRRAAFSYIRQHPGSEVSLTARKIVDTWWRDPKSTFTRNPAYLLPWIVTLVFFVWGLLKSFHSPRVYALAYIVFVVATLLDVIFFVVPRFRIPAYPFVFQVAALGVVAAGEILTARSGRWGERLGSLALRLVR
jgi:4-amino-4-deoxy-L-arabinose transferase-like glycosyltransferase